MWNRLQSFIVVFCIFAVLVVVFYSNIFIKQTQEGNTGSTPVLVSSYDTVGGLDAQDVFVYENFAYVVTDNNSGGNPEVYVFDVVNPAAPKLLSSYNVGTRVNKIFVNAEYAFLATDNDSKELIVLSLANKSALSEVASFDIPGNANALSIYGLGFKIYIGTGLDTASGRNEFRVLDIKNLPTITEVGSYNIDANIYDIVVTKEMFDEALLQEFAYLATSANDKEFIALDTSNYSSIILSSSYNSPGNDDARGIDFSFGKVYGATFNNGLQPDFFVFEAAASTSLSYISSVNLGTNNYDVEVYKDTAFIAGGDGVRIVNIANPSQLTLMSFFNLGHTGTGVKVLGDMIYLSSQHNTLEFSVIDPRIFTPTPVIQDINHDSKIEIIILGDSNSAMVPYGATSTDFGWPRFLQQFIGREDVIVKSRAIGLATINDNGWFDAYDEIGWTMAHDNPDAIIYAFGIADVINGYSSMRIFNAYRDIDELLERKGIVAIPALVPPILPPDDPRNSTIGAADYVILSMRPQNQIINFFTEMSNHPEYYFDAIHFNEIGHTERGARAFAIIQPLL